ncbi:hypothetical protein OSTOST_00664 [Ostertagia ostertagi]
MVYLLQDLLGLYDATVATTSHTSSHIPSSNGLFSSANADPGLATHRRKSAGECNHTFTTSDEVEQIRKCSHERKVHFDDEHLISGYFEASAPKFSSMDAKSEGGSGELDVDGMLSSYRRACQNLGIATITSVERQIEAAIALSEMLEFYESAHKLNLSFNKQITGSRMDRCVQTVKNKSLSALCRVLRGQPQPVLGVLHCENVNLYGKNLYTLFVLEIQHCAQGHGVAKICEALRNPEVVKKLHSRSRPRGTQNYSHWCENCHLETLNIGSNPLGEMGVQRLRPALGGNGSAILLAECLADNSTLIRVDLRDNPGIGSAGLLALHSAMKINRSISLLNLDQSCVVASNAKEDFRRYYEDIKRYCERNKGADQQKTESGKVDVSVSKSTANEELSQETVVKQEQEVKPADIIITEADLSPSHCQLLPMSSSGAASTGVKGKFMRSSSLTCTETVADIHERLRVLGGSTHSLDETNVDSTKTIKKCSSSSHNSLGLAEWGSLPAIPQANMAAKPVVRKLRRFSVSPSSSTFDVSKAPQTSSANNQELPRPKTLTIGISGTGELSEGPLSLPIMRPALPDSVDSWSTYSEKERDGKIFAEESATSTSRSNSAFDDEHRTRDSAAESAKSSDGTSRSSIDSTNGNTDESSSQNSQTILNPEELMRDVRIVIGDLVNYVVYEETSRIERKRSLLLQTTSFPAGELISSQGGFLEELTPTKTCTTPSRMVNIAEEVTEESEQLIVSGVVRGMVREVLRREKEELRSTLDRRRKRSVVPSNTPV